MSNCASQVSFWPIATNFSLGPDVSFWGEPEAGRAAESAASGENDPFRHAFPEGRDREQTCRFNAVGNSALFYGHDRLPAMWVIADLNCYRISS